MGQFLFVLNFGDQSAVIGSELLEFTVNWPGIPGDSKPFSNTTYDQDLFPSTEFDDAVAGDDPVWEDDDESEADDAD